MLTNEEKLDIIRSFARTYEKRCEREIGYGLEALYMFGSYSFGKINLEMPDINYLLLIKERAQPDLFINNF